MNGAPFDRFRAWLDERFTTRPSWIVLVELFVGVGWLRAAISKVPDAQWWSGRVITEFMADHESLTIGWFRPVLDQFVAESTSFWAGAILVAEFAIGITLIVGGRNRSAFWAGIFLCVSFVLAGATNPAVFYLVLQMVPLFWAVENGPSIQAKRILGAMTLFGSVVVVSCLPYISTLRPSLVIDDPAAVLVFGATCVCVAAASGHRRLTRQLLDLPDVAAATVSVE